MFGLLALGLCIAASSIAGIVSLARSHKDRQGSGAVFSVLGIILLSLLALGGTAAAGCAAVMNGSHF
jgi:hypothetical protein